MKKLSMLSLAVILTVILILSACAGSTPAPTTTQAPKQPMTSSSVPATSTSASKTTVPSTTLAPSSTQTAPITLTWAGFHPPGHIEYTIQNKYIVDAIKERSKGQLIIKFIGGPETIAAQDMGMAVKNGVVDMGMTIVGNYNGLVPGINLATFFRLPVDQERKTGSIYDYFQGIHKKAGLFYLGRMSPHTGNFFYTYIAKKLETPADFKGFKMASGTAARYGVLAWGCAAELLTPADTYSAFEHKLVEGTSGQPLSTPRQYGWVEKIRYVIDEPFFASTISMFMNLNKWNQLPKHLQELIELEIMPEYEMKAVAYNDKINDDERAFLISKGIQFYKLSPENTKWYLDTMYNATFADLEKKHPKELADLKVIMAKFQ